MKASNEYKVLLILDNHSSHLNFETLNLAKENGIVMLYFQPHCSHKLHPLDVSVFGPFKKYLSGAQDAWLRYNPGKAITIYDIPKGQSVKDSINKETTLLIPKTPEAFSPKTVRPYPKAAPRKINLTGRRKRKTAIKTDTPERNILKQQQTNKLKKVEKQKKLSTSQSFADCGNKMTLFRSISKLCIYIYLIKVFKLKLFCNYFKRFCLVEKHFILEFP